MRALSDLFGASIATRFVVRCDCERPSEDVGDVCGSLWSFKALVFLMIIWQVAFLGLTVDAL